MFWMLIAAQITAAQAVQEVSWFTPEDLSVEQIPPSGTALVLYRATVAPDGRLLRCEVEVSSGNAQLDKHTCDLVNRRARFVPAKFADGTPTYGVYRSSAIWAVDANGGYPTPVDIKLTVNQLPQGIRSPASVDVMFVADEQGRPSSCAATSERANATLVAIACQQLVASYIAAPAKDESGNSVRSVQDAVVAFVKH